ncbi:MAG: C1 family peptidase [Bacteroidales bacterium]|nr:C1 family peptidase [Bacteroidales bacterium]
MKKTVLSLALAAVALVASAQSQSAEDLVFTPVKENPITSVKNQSRSGTCWGFSALGFFESELIRIGKGEHDLAESFVVHHTMLDRARQSVRTHGDVSFSQGGSFYDVIYAWQQYGIVPQSAMAAPGSLYGDTLYNHNELAATAEAYVASIAKGKQKKLSPIWNKTLVNLYDNYLGEVPAEFTYQGKKYTPKSFAASLGLNMDDYVSITSFTHHPFYKQFVIEVPDNWRWALSYNIPLDELMRTMKHAVETGYTIAWGSDVSESYFGRDGVAKDPTTTAADAKGSDAARWTGTDVTSGVGGGKLLGNITQEMRQEAYDNWETTDDHGMQIYGIAKDQHGKEYFMVKNSWGNAGKYNGIFYATYPFVAYKTMNIVVHKNAIPKDIRKKLGI